MLFLKVNKRDAERIRRKCIELGILNNEYKVESEKEFVYIPILENKKIKKLGKIIEKKGTKTKKRAKENLVSSYDMLGDIIIIEIPKKLKRKEKLIAENLLKTHPNIKTIAKKYGAVKGRYRTRKVKIIAGKKTKETLHKEHGCRFKLNIENVYYSVRLSGERGRINSLVKNKEKILALFAGVGPFPIIIAKNHRDVKIVAIELNPYAVKYMKENIKLNKIKNVEIIKGDVKKIVPKRFKNWADRVLMPLPMGAEKFLNSAIKGVKNNGIMHFYNFVNSQNPFEEAEKIINKETEKLKVKYKIIGKRIIRSYSPKIVQVVIDFKIKK